VVLAQLGACQRTRAKRPLPLAFFAGTALGALGYEAAGPWVLALPAAVTGALALWAVRARQKGVDGVTGRPNLRLRLVED
jgi:hypothetical protein